MGKPDVFPIMADKLIFKYAGKKARIYLWITLHMYYFSTMLPNLRLANGVEEFKWLIVQRFLQLYSQIASQ
jgi:hypothetical protein